jgi:UDP-N-acetylmuramate dehydrogenase
VNPTSATTIYGDLDVQVELDAPIGTRTWFNTGGTADVLLHPANVEVVSEIVRRCRRTKTPLRIMGEGANMLVSDAGIDGIVLRLDTPAFLATEFNADGNVELMRVGAGADMARSLMDATRRGLSGLAQMAGIPASIGGAIRMNAGGAFGSIGDAVEAVACLSKSGEVNVYPKSELHFEYRSTNIPDGIVLWAVFHVTPTDPVELRSRVKEIFAYKKSTQPLSEKTAGCMFKNPVQPGEEEPTSAGKIIDQVGLKGHRVGTAEVSSIHANFITIDRGGRADDAIALAEEVVRQVKSECGIELEREVVVWRRGEETSTI